MGVVVHVVVVDVVVTGVKPIIVQTMLVMTGTLSFAGQEHHVARDKGADERHNQLH